MTNKDIKFRTLYRKINETNEKEKASEENIKHRRKT